MSSKEHEVKKVFSFRQYPTKYKETLTNAETCGTTLSKIIDDAFEAFNKAYYQMNNKR